MAAATDIGPFLSHTGFSGRAEYGLTGSDDFQIKVSADGTTRFNALQLERTSGPVRPMGALQRNPNAGDCGTVADHDLGYNFSTGNFCGRQGGVSIDLARGAAATAGSGVLQATYRLTSTTTARKTFYLSTNGALSLAAGTYRFSCSLLIIPSSPTEKGSRGTTTLYRSLARGLRVGPSQLGTSLKVITTG